MDGFNKIPETLAQDENLELVPYTSITDINKKNTLKLIYNKTLNNNNIDSNIFLDKLDLTLNNKGLTESNILATKLKNNNIYLYFDDGTREKISLNGLKESTIKGHIGNDSIKDIEQRANKLNDAISSIFYDNKNHLSLWNDEINNEDKVKSGEFKGKTLIELKRLLDVENTKLLNIYKINGDTRRYVKLLKIEIKHYVGIGDTYEGGARYFSMSKKEIDKKIRFLSSGMSISELIIYLKKVNKDIDDNYKKSDMVNQVNGKLINSLTEKIFDRLVKENSSDREFIDFAKAITGRGKLEILKGEKYSKKTNFEYSNLDIEDEYIMVDKANQVLLYVMYRKGGVLEKIKEKRDNNILIEDKEISGREPLEIIDNFIWSLSKLKGDDLKYGKEVIKNAGYPELLETNKPYKDLTFDEKIFIGALARIINILKYDGIKFSNPLALNKKLQETVNESFTELNESFSENFDETLFDWNGVNSKELGLSGEFAEIFDLYQDINGNEGAFDWTDKNKGNLMGVPTAVVLGVGIISGAILLAPLLTGTTVGIALIKGGIIAGAKIGAIMGVTSSIVQTQGYDTFEEGTWDIGAQTGTDIVMSAIFAGVGLPVIHKLGNVNPDLILSKEAWTTTAGLTDKGFIVGEVAVTGVVLSPIFSQVVKGYFPESHFDTDEEKFYESDKKLDK